MDSACQRAFHATTEIVDRVFPSDSALLTEPDVVKLQHLPLHRESPPPAEELRDPEDEGVEFTYYETGDEASLATPWSTDNVLFEKSEQSTHINVQSTVALEHWLAEADAKRDHTYYAMGHEDCEVTPWPSSKSVGTRPSWWSNQGGQQRRRRRPGCVKIAECLVALDHVEDTRRILRFSRTRPLGLHAEQILKSHLEAQHGRVSMTLAGNMERKHSAGMFFVVMERTEDAVALMAGAEERELAIGDAVVLVRTFKRTSDQ